HAPGLLTANVPLTQDTRRPTARALLPRQHMLTQACSSAYADEHAEHTRNRRGRGRQRPGHRVARGSRPTGTHRTAGDPPGRQRARTGLVVAGHRHPARRHQADRAPQARPPNREAVMPEQFTGDARQVVDRASAQARRLGHGFVGGEHLLYGLAGTEGEVGAVLRERGVTPERVEAEFVRLIGPRVTASGSLFDPLDRDALTTIGIALEAVRERIEAAFGPDALAPDAPAPRRWRRPRPGQKPGPITGPIPLTRRARKCLESSRRAAQAH